MDELSAWIGRSETAQDAITPRQARQMAATLGGLGADRLGLGDPLPPLWHWMGWTETTPMADLGPDGHRARGGFLPPVPLPRRMWAGGRLRFLAPLPIGACLTRVSRVVALRERAGRAGRVVFVTVRHEVQCEVTATAILHEEHDIAYVARSDPYRPPPPVPAPAGRLWHHPEACDPVRLFRYSALTFNGHRIHYDLEYTTASEGYPGLLVHGPLQAALLLQAARRHAPGRAVAAFRFRALQPVFHTDSLTLAGWPEVPDAAADPFAPAAPAPPMTATPSLPHAANPTVPDPYGSARAEALWPAQPLATLNAEGLVCLQAHVVWAS